MNTLELRAFSYHYRLFLIGLFIYILYDNWFNESKGL